MEETENETEEQQRQTTTLPSPPPTMMARAQISTALGCSLATAATVGVFDVAAHLGPTGIIVGGLAAIAAWRHGPELLEKVQVLLPERSGEVSPQAQVSSQPANTLVGERSQRRSVLDRALGRFPEDVPEEAKHPIISPDSQETAFVQATMQRDVPGVRRLTVDEIVQHTEPNSYKVYIGRSLTKPGHPAILTSFYKRHIKLIGASQYGKSSMAAALLDIITRTHDPEHVLVALLDLEDQTSRLFARLPHLCQVTIDGQPVTLHAHNPEQVLEHLGYLLQIMEYRYTLSKSDLLQEPLLLVYLEEFIALKDYFKSRVDAVAKGEREQAQADYANLVFAIKELARRALKVRMQLLMCAQCDYRDNDLQEALINVTAGMSFCVRVTAAQAAGFYQADLLARNARDDKKGQAVVEMPDCKDLVLAPDYDLEAYLITLEQAELREAQRRSRGHTSQYPSHHIPSMMSKGEQMAAAALRRTATVPPPMPAVEELLQHAQSPLSPAAVPTNNITVLPLRSEQIGRQPTITDAIICWNELIESGQNPSRLNLREALIAKGFECRENWARKFCDDIREMVMQERQTQQGSVPPPSYTAHV